MIHVDVKRSTCTTESYLVETSTDGAGWRVHYECTVADAAGANARVRAETLARAMLAAWSYAGIPCRGTSCGYSL